MSILVSENARWLETPDGLVVLNLSTGRCYHLTPTASAAWKDMVNHAKPSLSAEQLEDRTQLPQAQIDEKQANFIQYFKTRGLLL
jgi:Coenzyme PQQ synthesis protein D (PqqD)